MKKARASKPESTIDQTIRPSREDFLIVGIGASAGGVQALKEFFENVSSESGMAYVVILHLSPDYDSQLATILQSVAAVPVTQVTKKVLVKPNHIYVVPPNQSLKMLAGHIVVEPIHTVEERRAPVDIFFRTLADSHQARAVAVVLSGTGANGSMGMKRVKECGGAVFVQNPREAEYSDMPRNSIATDLVDAILNVGEIPAKILAYKESRLTIEIPDEPESRPESDQAALREILTHLRVRTGNDFANYKRATVLRRLERRINVRELPNLPAYAAFLRENPEETQILLKDLLISVTNFFRDKQAFLQLEAEIIPKILTNHPAGSQLRIWVAGCATGEEAYSVAMLLAEKSLDTVNFPSVQIFGSDMDEAAIATAREGLYTLNDAADVSPERLNHFFTKEANGYRIRRELREMVLFAPHNLLKDPPFSHLDLVTCRNLLIYFNQTAQERVMETLHFALNPGGFLFLGSSESIDGAGDLYAPVSKEFNIFQSRQVAPRTIPVPDSPFRFNLPTLEQNDRTLKPTQEQENRVLERISFADLHQRLLEQYASPSLIVNEDYDIVHLSESAGRFLQMAGGEPSNNLLKMIRPELRLELRTALYQAIQKQTNVEAKNLRFQSGDRMETINVQIRPVLRADDTARGFILIIFEMTREISDTVEAIFTIPDPVAHHLEEELIHIKSQLRSSNEQFDVQTEELKASNEELQAMNEELRSAAEELETSKEELQSVNEELITVNQELKIKIEEILQSNNDFQNLINSTDIGTVFLDRTLRVKLFTPAAREIFNLIPADLGRPLSDITSRLEDTDLIGDAEIVLEKLRTIEHEVQTDDQRTYLMQILPYRTAEDRISGVVVTFVNITHRKQAEENLVQSEKHFRAIVDQAATGIGEADLTGKFTLVNDRYSAITGYTRQEMLGLRMQDITHPEDLSRATKLLEKCLATGKPFNIEKRYIRKSGDIVWVSNSISVIADSQGIPLYTLTVSLDITTRKETENKLSESEENLRLVLESATDYAIIATDPAGFIKNWNRGAENIFGYTEKEIIGQSAEVLFTPEDSQVGIPQKEMRTALERGRAEDERWHIRQDGSRFFASGVMTPLAGGSRGFVKIARDQTGRIESEKAYRDKEMLQRMLGAQEDERKRIARDLHDQLGQQLTALRLKLEATRKECKVEEICAKIDEVNLIVKRIDSDVDFLAWELRPAALDDLGLVATLTNYVNEWSRHSGVAAEFHSTGLRRKRLLPEIETNLYRITQEALNNIQKYAAAKKVDVMLEKRHGIFILIIEDDGKGFDPESKRYFNKGLGLIGMQERAALIGGSVEIESAPKQGTTIFTRIPERYAEENGREKSKKNRR